MRSGQPRGESMPQPIRDGLFLDVLFGQLLHLFLFFSFQLVLGHSLMQIRYHLRQFGFGNHGCLRAPLYPRSGPGCSPTSDLQDATANSRGPTCDLNQPAPFVPCGYWFVAPGHWLPATSACSATPREFLPSSRLFAPSFNQKSTITNRHTNCIMNTCLQKPAISAARSLTSWL